jgi:23S rRNA (guanosine2251-2'-O)-methyltransferase
MNEWIYGRNPIYETLRAGRREMHLLQIAQGVQPKGRVEGILALARQKGIHIEEIPRQVLDKRERHNQGVMLQVGEYPYQTIHDIEANIDRSNVPGFILILDSLQDPQNLGTLLRTAEAVGVHGVVLPYRRAATVTPAVVNASSGACEHLTIIQTNLAQTIEALKEMNIWVYGMDSGPDAQPVSQLNLDGPIALVVGNEGEGLRQLVRKSCDVILQLPMSGHIESLNASVAGSVALYMAWQARGYSS